MDIARIKRAHIDKLKGSLVYIKSRTPSTAEMEFLNIDTSSIKIITISNDGRGIMKKVKV